jgi:hypothetical protein
MVRTCLEKDPDDRWQSALDIQRTLDILRAAQATPEQQSSRSGVRKWIWVAAAVALTVGILGAWSRFRLNPAGDVNQPIFSQIPLPEDGTIAAGSSNTLAVSSDGSMIAFVAMVNQETGVWIREMKGNSAQRVPGSRGAEFVIWSPNSKSVAFRIGDGIQLFRYDVGASAPVAIATMPLPPTFGAGWGSEGSDGTAHSETIVFGGTRGMMRMPGSGGIAIPIAVSNATQPVILPGGRFLYTSVNGNGSVWAAPLDHPENAVEILNEATVPVYVPRYKSDGGGGNEAGYLLWIRGKTLLAREFDPRTLTFAGKETVIAEPAWTVAASARLLLYDPAPTMTQLAEVNMDGSGAKPVGDPAPIVFSALSNDGRRVVLTVARNTGVPGSGLSMLDTSRGVLSPFAADLGADTSPAWSYDDRAVMFGTGSGLARIMADGVSEAERILNFPRRLNPTDWSKNGSVLYNQVGVDGSLDIMTLQMTPDGRPSAERLYVNKKGDQRSGRFSPNGDWVAYQSDETGKNEIFIDTFPDPHGSIQISIGGGFGAQWNPKGGQLFYRSLDNKLMAVPIHFENNSAMPSPPQVLFPLPVSGRANFGAQYDVEPDGNHFLIQLAVKKAPLNVITNWQALLKK